MSQASCQSRFGEQIGVNYWNILAILIGQLPFNTCAGAGGLKFRRHLWIVCKGVKQFLTQGLLRRRATGRSFRSFAGWSSRLRLVPVRWPGGEPGFGGPWRRIISIAKRVSDRRGFRHLEN